MRDLPVISLFSGVGGLDVAVERAGPVRVAVFVDGCFWHACPDHGTRPETNADYGVRSLTAI